MKKKFLIIITISVFFLLTILGGVFFYLFNFYQSAPSADITSYAFTINEGETVSQIANNLQKECFIKHELMFRYVVRKEGFILQAGEYQIPKNLNVNELASKLTKGTFDTKITIIEGWRREEIADYLLSNNVLPKITANETDVFSLRLNIINKIKEGYFYPDTYVLPKNTNLSELIQIVKNSFNLKVDNKLISQFQTQGLTLDEAVILASIVEREARTSESRMIVAGILLKRWQNDWPLEADATVQYSIADRDCVNKSNCTWWTKEITENDLAIDSPFNTRKNLGLPPEAICNPSLSSMQAVADPNKTEYWFYLTGKDGKMYYAKTLTEHNENIAKYL